MGALTARIRALDPGHVGLARGLRAAIALPVGLAFMLGVLHMPDGASFASFGIIGLLVTADYAGTAVERLRAYLLTGLIGIPVLLLGWVVSGHALIAALLTVLVGFLLSALGVVRGTLAVGAPAILIVFLLAACIGSSGDKLGDALIGWVVAVVVSTACALVIMPRGRQDEVRESLGRAVRLFAQAAREAWLDDIDVNRTWATIDAADAEVEKLAAAYSGKPFRPSSATSASRALTMLVDQVYSLRSLIATLPRQEVDLDPEVPEQQAFATQVIASLDDIAQGLEDGTSIPDVQPLITARSAFREAMARAALRRSREGMALSDIGTEIQFRHTLSIAGLLTEQMGQLTRELNGASEQVVDGSLATPRIPAAVILRTQFDPRSPWFRTSLRKGIGLGIAMLIITLTNLDFGFWVLLGIVAILRFDALTTRRSAWQALLGTALGVFVASAVLFLIGSHEVVLWVIMPIVVFIAAWSSVALQFPVAQGILSGFVILLVNLTDWPPSPLRAEVRLLDIALGAAIAAVVAMIMWPHGAAGVLRKQVATNIQASWDFLRTVLGSLSAHGSQEARQAAYLQAHRVSVIAAETYDVAVMQRGSGFQNDRLWATLTGDARLMLRSGRIIDFFIQGHPVAQRNPQLDAAIESTIANGDNFWNVVTRCVDERMEPPRAATHELTDWKDLNGTLHDFDEAMAFLLCIWAVDWCDRIEEIASLAFDRIDASPSR